MPPALNMAGDGLMCLLKCRLQDLYVHTDASPIPRPLFAHYPSKTEKSLWRRIAVGHVEDVSL
jgi:hypothetical protein